MTQGEDVPDRVRGLVAASAGRQASSGEEEDEVHRLAEVVDLDDVVEVGSGDETVYAYGYACAPDRLRIGSAHGDPVARIAAQISTGTPDRPRLSVPMRTHDCIALERALHALLRLRGRKVPGAGAEWFLVTREELVTLHRSLLG